MGFMLHTPQCHWGSWSITEKSITSCSMANSALINCTLPYMGGGAFKIHLVIPFLHPCHQFIELFTQIGPSFLETFAVTAHLTHAVAQAVLPAALAASQVASGLRTMLVTAYFTIHDQWKIWALPHCDPTLIELAIMFFQQTSDSLPVHRG